MKGPVCSCGDITRSRIVQRWPVWECLSCGRVEWLATRIEALESFCTDCNQRLLLFTSRRTGKEWLQCDGCGQVWDLPPKSEAPGREASSA